MGRRAPDAGRGEWNDGQDAGITSRTGKHSQTLGVPDSRSATSARAEPSGQVSPLSRQEWNDGMKSTVMQNR